MKNSIGDRLVPAMLAADMSETIAFYKRLGFNVSDQYPDELSPTWAQVKRDGITLQFHIDPPNGTPPSPICSGTFYMFTDDVEALANELQSTIKFEWGPEIMPYGQKEFGIKDPNGYYLAFAQPT